YAENERMSQSSTLSVASREISYGAYVIAAAALGRRCAFAFADGGVVLMGTDGGSERLETHPGAGILAAAGNRSGFVGGGDGGRSVAMDAAGRMQDLADEKGVWIDAVAVKADGATAWSAGRTVKARDAHGGMRVLACPSSVRGLCFFD